MKSQAILLLAICAGAASATPQYHLVDLGPLFPAGSFSSGRNVSTNGIALAYTAGINNAARTWSPSTGSVTLALHPSFNRANPEAVNNSGMAVGTVQTGNFGTAFPTYWIGGTPTLYTLPSGYGNGRAYGLNNNAVACGSVGGGSGERACYYQTGGSTLLGTINSLPLQAAYDVNDSSRICGQYIVDNNYHAFIWEIETGIGTDIGMLPGDNGSIAFAISNSGAVTGTSMLNQGVTSRAFLWTSGGGMIEVPGVSPGNNCQGRGINSQNWVVGTDFSVSTGFVWDGTQTYALAAVSDEPASFQFQSAWGISDSGWIVGQAVEGGVNHAYALQPADAFGPSTYTVASGTLFGGNLASLQSSDNLKLYLLCDEFDSNGEVRFSGNTWLPAVQSISLLYECSATRNDLSQFFEAFNYSTNNWTILDVRNSTLVDSVVTKSVTSGASAYVGTGGETKCRLRWIPNSDIDAADGWTMSVDQIRWSMAG